MIDERAYMDDSRPMKIGLLLNGTLRLIIVIPKPDVRLTVRISEHLTGARRTHRHYIKPLLQHLQRCGQR